MHIMDRQRIHRLILDVATSVGEKHIAIPIRKFDSKLTKATIALTREQFHVYGV